MKKQRKQFCTLFISLLFRVVLFPHVAFATKPIDVLSEYAVHSLPNDTVGMEVLHSQQSDYSLKTKSVQNNDFNLINQSNNVRSKLVNSLSTSTVQQSWSEVKNESGQTSERVEVSPLTNVTRRTDVQDFLKEVYEDSGKLSHVECLGIHNAQKRYSVTQSATLLLSLLKKGRDGFYNQFRCDDPYDIYIPQAARSIYRKSITWTPKKSVLTKTFEDAYLQCVTYIFMSYEMAGKSIHKQGRTHAADLLDTKYTGPHGQFFLFKSGKSVTLPQEGDIIVWSRLSTGTAYGHVGIVLEVRDDSMRSMQESNLDLRDQSKKRFGTILVANANSTQLVYEYQYIVDANTQIVTLDKLASSWVKVPDYWLRMKEEYENQ